MAKIEQRATQGVTSTVDNIALQVILGLLKGIRTKDRLLVVKLNKCSHCEKQRIYIEDMEGEEIEEDNEQCFLCEKPVDAELVIYTDNDKQVICLMSEAEDLIKEQ